MDDDLGIVYKESVLGKNVWIKFDMGLRRGEFQFFRGVITRMESYYPEDDPSKPLEYRHYVVFADDDDGYYDLMDLEMTGYLKWHGNEVNESHDDRKKESNEDDGDATESEKEFEFDSNDEDDDWNPSSVSLGTRIVPSAAAAAAAAATVTAVPGTPPPAARPMNARVVTPQKRPSTSRTENDSDARRKKARVKTEPGLIPSNFTDLSSDEINLDEFSHWLKHIHTNSKGSNISQANARSVINRVKDLISARGITYKNWPLGIVFHKEQTRAKDFEKQYGEDKGHGWLLQHPIKKLLLYKEYVEQKRYERDNPIDCM